MFSGTYLCEKIFIYHIPMESNSNELDKYGLTQREREVLKCLMLGDSYKMIADACGISMGTVFTHISHIYKKLQVNSKIEAVIKAMRENICLFVSTISYIYMKYTSFV